MARSDCGGALDTAVALNERQTEAGQSCPAAMFSAGFPLYGGLTADPVDLVDKVPGPFVGHLHGASRGRDGPELSMFSSN